MASDTKSAQDPTEEKTNTKNTALGEDDEFEDFPVDGSTDTLSVPKHTLTGSRLARGADRGIPERGDKTPLGRELG